MIFANFETGFLRIFEYMDDFVPGYVGLTALGSGSGGNAYVLHSPHGNYMVDAGFSRN